MHSKNSTPIKQETCNVNVLCHFWVKYGIIQEFIVKRNIAIKLKRPLICGLFMWDIYIVFCEKLAIEVCPSVLYTFCIQVQFFVDLRAKKIRGREFSLVFNSGWFLGCIFPRCTNLGRQVARANKFCTATLVFVGSQYGSWLMSPFWWQECWGGFYILEKVVPPCITQ